MKLNLSLSKKIIIVVLIISIMGAGVGFGMYHKSKLSLDTSNAQSDLVEQKSDQENTVDIDNLTNEQKDNYELYQKYSTNVLRASSGAYNDDGTTYFIASNDYGMDDELLGFTMNSVISDYLGFNEEEQTEQQFQKQKKIFYGGSGLYKIDKSGKVVFIRAF